MSREFDVDVPMVDIDSGTFKAVVPWTVAMNKTAYMTMAITDDTALQIAVAMREFIGMLSPDKLEEFEALDMSETVEVLSQWFQKSTKMMVGHPMFKKD